VTTQQPRSRRRPTISVAKCRRAATDNRVHAYTVVHTACDGAIDISAAALPSHGGDGYLAEYPVKPHLRSPVSICAASNSWGAVSAAADASAGREDATPLLQDASR
jgi:alkylation response protein AidB-like acyl-CoA dehydrogenase